MRKLLLPILCTFSFAGGYFARLQQIPTHQQLLKQTQSYLHNRDFGQCRDTLLQMLLRRSDEMNSQERLLLAKLSSDAGDWSTVVAALSPITDTDPQAATVRVAEGDAWRRLARASKAEQCWKRALELDPNSRQARNGLLYLYSIQMRRREWLTMLWQMYDRRQAGEKELLQLLIAGQIVWESTDMLRQIAVYAAADPDDVHSHRALAIYTLEAGHGKQAIDRLMALRQRFPDDVETWFVLVEALLATGDTQQAGLLLSHAPSGAEQDYRFPKFVAFDALLREDYQAAQAAFKESIALYPFDLEVRNKYAQTLRFLNDQVGSLQQARFAFHLSMIQRLAHTIETAGWDLDNVKELIGHCESVGLIEEAIGWVTLARQRAGDDTSLAATQERLATLTLTSSRKPPQQEPTP